MGECNSVSSLEEKIEALIRRHLSLRPEMRATDAYKLLYQGVLGVRHLLNDDARRWLESEAEGLNLEDPHRDPLVEEISVDGSFVRVNLRPYLRRGLNLDRLFAAMKESSRTGNGREEEFARVWNAFVELVRLESLAFDLEEVEAVDGEAEQKEYPPRHHSEAYRAAYSPSYRVVSKEVLKRRFKPDEIHVNNDKN